VREDGVQSLVVTNVQTAKMWLDKTATEDSQTECQLPKLDQAILANVFRIELVPQHPEVESASGLLECTSAARSIDARAPHRGYRSKG
jgi:hypothetical protein